MRRARLLRTAMTLLACGLVSMQGAGSVLAHELRPAYLELLERSPGSFDVTWKLPRVNDASLALEPRLPGTASASAPALRRATDGATLASWTADLGELRGKTVGIGGLDGTMTDALVRIELLDGYRLTRRLDARAPDFVVPARESGFSVAATWLRLGVEHILAGFDHLLFVATLLLVTGWRRPLVGAVTAFTLAHSATLALATFGLLAVPQQPVEAMIALSIAFMAAELLRRQQGREGLASSATWTVAFAFGLLHGLGFAGALAEVGLPHGHIPVALLFFNAGVELGQLLFLALLYPGSALLLRVSGRRLPALELAGAYAIGAVSMFWVIERVAAY